MKNNPKLAFVFPGQGSQSVGMLSEMASQHPQIVETFDEASSVFGQNLWRLVCEGPAEVLGRTEFTQVLMLIGGVALWRVWTAQSEWRPELLAGHSLGEYAALVAADSLPFSAAVHAVAERGRLMQEAVSPGDGAMAAILGLEDETVEAICREMAEGQVVAAANYNCPGQIVITGDSAAVERAMQACLTAGARRAMMLPVSVPAHCSLMAPAAQAFRQVLAEISFQSPKIAVIHNADLQSHASAEAIRSALEAQICAPVPWTSTIRQLRQHGVEVFGECGPGRVLSALGRRIDRDSQWLALDTPAGMDALLQLAIDQQ